MGLRGPLRQVDSRRGVEENAVARLEAPEQIAAPAWLTARAKAIFSQMVTDCAAARVPVKKADTHAFAMAAYCVASVELWAEREVKAKNHERQVECGKMVARFQRDAQAWLDKTLQTTQARIRVGLKPAPEKKLGAIASITQAKSVIAAQRKQGNVAV